MAVDVAGIVAEYLAGNHGLSPADPERRQTPNYGVVARLAGDVLEVELTFRSGSAYCCYEWGCHVALIDGKRWDGFRHLLAVHGIAAPPRLELRQTCVIEEGAIFFDFSRPDPTRRGWYAFAPVAAQRRQATAIEGPSPGEPSAAPDRPGD
ncbi:MAG TPA: hypothetical protein VFE78_37580 [Gemmataceae bacterium]|nr:hypothetical protein [Gemmataceae bacterium]